jgi:hypothetical protein
MTGFAAIPTRGARPVHKFTLGMLWECACKSLGSQERTGGMCALRTRSGASDLQGVFLHMNLVCSTIRCMG